MRRAMSRSRLRRVDADRRPAGRLVRRRGDRMGRHRDSRANPRAGDRPRSRARRDAAPHRHRAESPQRGGTASARRLRGRAHSRAVPRRIRADAGPGAERRVVPHRPRLHPREHCRQPPTGELPTEPSRGRPPRSAPPSSGSAKTDRSCTRTRPRRACLPVWAESSRSVLGLDNLHSVHTHSVVAADPPVSCTISGLGIPCTYSPKGFWKAYDAQTRADRRARPTSRSSPRAAWRASPRIFAPRRPQPGFRRSR